MIDCLLRGAGNKTQTSSHVGVMKSLCVIACERLHGTNFARSSQSLCEATSDACVEFLEYLHVYIVALGVANASA